MKLDAVIVGAGFAGLYALYRLRALGLKVRAFEAGDGVGGTWFWNRYPGARCDAESVDYSYSFSPELEQEWSWSERYASQPEILRYLNHVADRFDLRRDIQLETRVVSAVYDEDSRRWLLETDRGDRVAAQFVVMASGCLSSSQMPRYPGHERFAGMAWHTANWPKAGVDFSGKRVGVIGTGSTAIQAIPHIASQAAHVVIFQRTANFSIPANNFPLDPAYQRAVKAGYRERRRKNRESRQGADIRVNPRSALEDSEEQRQRWFESRWREGGLGAIFGAYSDLTQNEASNATLAEFVRGQIRKTVKNQDVAERLCPSGYPLGAKRICVDTGYYETYNRDNITLVDIRKSPIEEITPDGVRTRDASYALDAIVYATGFDAMTGALLGIDIRGRGGRTLREKWAAGPRSYLGIQVSGFPNLFTITGPGSPSVLGNMIVSIEQHVEWTTECIANLRSNNIESIEAKAEAEDAWVEHVNAVAGRTLYPKGNSWYLGANIPGKPRVFMPYAGGVGAYRVRCDQVANKWYEGFVLS